MKAFKNCSIVALVVGCILVSTQALAVDLKFATLAPQGTSLYKKLQEAGGEIKAKTGGRVSFTIFGGGTAGDEKDFVRKMNFGELQGAALTGVGLGLIDPQIRVLELPFLFKDTATVDKTYAAMRDYFNSAFDKKGFVLLGWAEVGFVNIFSNKAIKKKEDLKGTKMWMWTGDPLAEEMYKALNVTPVPLAVTDVLTSLQTGMIDGAYAPPLGAIAFQWHTKTKFVTDINLVNGTGALIVSKKEWGKVSTADQAAVKAILDAKAKDLTVQSRKENAESRSALQASGLQIVTPDPAAVTELREIGLSVQKALVGRLYSQELLDKVLALAQ